MKRSVITSVLGLVSVCGMAAAQDGFKPILNGGRQPIEIFDPPVVACFAEGTDPFYAKQVEALVNQLNIPRFAAGDYQLNTRWSGSQGDPRALTWSFVPDGLSISSGVGEPVANSNLFSSMDTKFAAAGGRTTWVTQWVNSFARWQNLSGLTYTRITVGGNDWDDGAAWGAAGAAGVRGDVRICGKNIDGGSNILAYNNFPPFGGDMVMDTSENWQSSSGTFRFLRNTIMHEHGHGMGLNHVDPVNGTKLMEPFLNTGFDGPQQDDIRGAQRHYGDAYEGNNTSATAKPMGALAVPGSLTFGNITSPAVASAARLSIDANGEIDVWSFTVPAAGTLTATVTPVGSTYMQGPQGGATANVNALAQANLALEVLASNGTTVLGTANAAAVGLAESVTGISLPTAGTYFIRVTETDAPTQTQLYQISLTSTGEPVCPEFTTNPQGETTCVNAIVQLSAAASGNPAPTYQWRRNTVPIGGATSSTYNFIASGATAGSYDVVATNACGSTPSAAAVIVVNAAPGFTTQPSNVSVAVGSPASFSVVVSGSPTLQWRKNQVDIPGATGLSYNIASVTAGDAGTYDVVATNNCGVLESDPATLTVTSCYADCDGIGGLTANDFACFLTAYSNGQAYANCDGVGGLTANDFACFLNSYSNGCS
jgi:serralysin